ncbi:hypothetical protein NEHOM01_2391 [Nematocida homosporus]|uniref:uncharacterized protein n=1 Tax=Nematocida homosporus TaxID=1912981 RepID=UPI00221FE442|nr:uncharacterized protein NEHOM01_2391 [Nematocida homosporus]KAI5187819.1 hypothetical protein NEHOM01_2391 [Nematocida homosporus]
MKLSFEVLGVGLAWLLGWGSDMTSADNVTAPERRDGCAYTRDGFRLFQDRLRYSANPDCIRMDYKNNDILNDDDIPKQHLTHWDDLLASGLLCESEANTLLQMLSVCYIIKQPRSKECPFDIEKDSLSYALAMTIAKFQKRYDMAYEYHEQLKAVTKSTTGADIVSLFRHRSYETADAKYKLLKKVILKDYSKWLAYSNPFEALNITEDEIKNAVEAWKTAIKDESTYGTNDCLEHQLRYFLYDVLRIQLMASSFLNISKERWGRYVNGTISSEHKNEIDAILKLNVVDLIRNVPADEAAKTIYKQLSRVRHLGWWYYNNFQTTDLRHRLNELLNDLSAQYRSFEFSLDQIKQWADDMKMVSIHLLFTLSRAKQLQEKLAPELAKSTSSSSIHKCVEYLATKSLPASSSNTNLPPNSPMFHVAIGSLIWARLTHLFGLSS